MEVKQTERGWPGHLCVGHRCYFRRNTLLECENKKVVVSTVGNYINPDGDRESIGLNRWYETKAFYGDMEDGYIEANVRREIYFDSNSSIDSVYDGSDNDANDMHNTVINEISSMLLKGLL